MTDRAKPCFNHTDMLFLTLESFNKTGGLQSASRTLAKALAELSLTSEKAFHMMSLCDATETVDNRYVKPIQFKGFNYKRINFFLAAIRRGLSAEIIILSHINLLPVAYCVKLLAPKSRIILVAHGKEVWKDLRKWKIRFITRQMEIWAVSQFTRDILINKHGINGNNIQILNNCLDPYFKMPSCFAKPTYLLKRYEQSSAAPIIFSICRIDVYERNKGYDQVLECLPLLSVRFPTLKYILAGKMNPAEHCRICKKINDLSIAEHVILTGFVPGTELADHYLLGDLFIMPSTKEGFGLVFLEALACGRQVIAGNKDGSVDAVLNGELGTLVDPTSKDAIYTALVDRLQNPGKERASEIQEKTLKHFNFDLYKSRVQTLLQRSSSNREGTVVHQPTQSELSKRFGERGVSVDTSTQIGLSLGTNRQ